MIRENVVQKYSFFFQRYYFTRRDGPHLFARSTRAGASPARTLLRNERLAKQARRTGYGRGLPPPWQKLAKFAPMGPAPALVNTLVTYALVCMLALLITSCNWPGAQQTQQPDARLQSFHVLSARIIMLDTQAEVDGTLQNSNRTDRFPYDVTVIATFYNRAGNVVGQAGGVAEDVYPGMIRPFTLAGSVDSTQYSRMVVTVVSLKERRIEKIIPTPSVVP